MDSLDEESASTFYYDYPNKGDQDMDQDAVEVDDPYYDNVSWQLCMLVYTYHTVT